MVRVLSGADVSDLLSLEPLIDIVGDAFVKQGSGDVERPERPHYPLGTGLDGRDEPVGTGLVMPAYIHGDPYAATKLVSIHPDNPTPGRPTVDAQIALTDARDGRPVAYMSGTAITNARTGCIGGLAARELAVDGPLTVGVLGAGTQARWQTRAVAAVREIETVRVYAPSDSRERCASELADTYEIPSEPVQSAHEAVEDADLVVTATTSETPVFDGTALSPGTLVVAIGAFTPEMQEIDEATFRRAGRIYADVPEEVIEIGDLRATDLAESDLRPFAGVCAGDAVRVGADEIVVVESVGTATLDAAAAAWVYERAVERDVGVELSL